MADTVERVLFPPFSGASAEPPLELDAPHGGLKALQSPTDELVLSAQHKLTLRCGKSSITLYPNGKIVLRGEYILSDAAGTNRINGGRIELN